MAVLVARPHSLPRPSFEAPTRFMSKLCRRQGRDLGYSIKCGAMIKLVHMIKCLLVHPRVNNARGTIEGASSYSAQRNLLCWVRCHVSCTSWLIRGKKLTWHASKSKI